MFERAVIGSDEECSVFVEGLGDPGDGAVADTDADATAEGGAAAHPFVADLVEIAGLEAGIDVVEFAEDGRGKSGAVDGMSGLGLEGGDDGLQFGGQFGGGQVDIDSDAEGGMADAVEFGGEFEEDAGDLAMAEDDVIGPFDFGLELGFAFDGACDGDRGEDGEAGDGGGAEIRSEENGEPQAAAGW